MILLLKSFLAGIFLGIPAGPIGAIALKRMYVNNPKHGMFFAIGFAGVDFLYSILAGLGTYIVADFFIIYKNLLYSLGIVLFAGGGLKIFFTKPALNQESGEKNISYKSSIVAAFFLAALSPTTFISFTTVFAGLQLGFQYHQLSRGAIVVGGVLLGGLTWWFLLTFIVSMTRKKVLSVLLGHINHIFGIFMLLMVLLFAGMWICR